MPSDSDYIWKIIDLNDRISNSVKSVISKLKQHGFETYIVGGAVRDLLIDRTPKDYDIVTAATPGEIREIFGKRRAKIIGKRFKIVHLFSGNNVVEISTFRKMPNEANTDSPYPMITDDNEYGSPYEDARRRDFTINAIFYDTDSSKIIDFTSMGLVDLENKTVRTIGDPFLRFSEDPVRVLRALKLVGQYEFTLESETEKALLSLQEKIMLSSNARLSLELEKILKKSYSYKILKTFFEYGFLAYYIPALHRYFEVKEGLIGLKLLEMENSKLELRNSYEYISLPIALLSLPAIACNYTGASDDFCFEYDHAEKKNIRKIIRSLFLPLIFPKFVIYEAAEAIFMQSRIFNSERRHRLKRQRFHRNVYIACKLALVINDYSLRNRQVTEFCERILKAYMRE